MWTCRCTCGNELDVRSSHLLGRKIKSCGCLGLDLIRQRLIDGTNGAVIKTHGKSKASEYAVWNTMRQRCHNKKVAEYKDYGARGIRVCKRWRQSFQNFWDDMGPRPSARSTIERKDNNRGYNPENCVWATYRQQMRNRRKNRRITYRGQTKTLVEWAEVLGLDYKNLHHRLARGWTVERAFTQPQRRSPCS